MTLPGPRSFRFFSLFIFVLSATLSAFGSNDREVRIAFVQGDVNLSRGNGNRPDLNKPWEQAQAGEFVEQGFALATGNGRAEIEFENGSTAYLAENSLLLFNELSAIQNHIATRMTLATGTATVSVKTTDFMCFFVDTPTDHLAVLPHNPFFVRLTAYLDGTALTPQDVGGETILLGYVPLAIGKGETFIFRGQDTIVPPLDPVTGRIMIRAPISSQTLNEWDAWVNARMDARKTTTEAALKASGLSAPIPGLMELYAHGSFFSCEPYGTCWEPQKEAEQESDVRLVSPQQSPVPNQSNAGFQPQVVQWEDIQEVPCGPVRRATVVRVAHTPEELQKLLHQKELAERAPSDAFFSLANCYPGDWILHRGRYAMVVRPVIPPRCIGKRCKPVRPPHPVWVRAGKQIGLVPRHPNDVPGKPPINLKNGIIVPPNRPGQPAQQIAFSTSEKIKVLEKEPIELRNVFLTPAPISSPPVIHAHLISEGAQGKSDAAASRENLQITYDYRTKNFMMAGKPEAGTKSKEVAVGGITSTGRIASFADGHSGHYAESFSHTSAATSYAGGGSFSGSHYSGGGHGSGSSYSGSSYSGSSHSGSSYSGSSGSSSYGSHSSGGSSAGSSGSSGSGGSGGSGGPHSH